VTVPITFAADDHRGFNGMRMYRVENGRWNAITDFMTAPTVR
jgi:branched-chain amino acid transport system substrate-binding protein